MNSMILFSLFGNIELTLKLILAIIVVAFVVVLCKQIPQLIPVLASIMALVIVFFGIASTIDCAKYINAHNVTIGEIIDSAFNDKSTAEEVEGKSLAWDLTNLGFKFGSNNKYVTTIEKPHNEVIDLENNDYVLYINNEACLINETGNDYVKSEFNYSFFDRDNNLLLDDTLHIDFGFYQKQTTITISTYGGEQAVNLWKSFQVKNGFTFELKATKKSEYIPIRYQYSNRTELVDNISDDLFTINLYIAENLDFNGRGHSESDVKFISMCRTDTSQYSNYIYSDLNVYYKNTSKGYVKYSANFLTTSYDFLDIGESITQETPQGKYLLSNSVPNTNIDVLGYYTTISLNDYIGENPMGKILNIYIDSQVINT